MSQSNNSRGLLVVLGATGTQGSAVLKHFSQIRSASAMRLRGITRNPESATSKELHGLGVEMVSADLNDLASLKSAFVGATHIFATTDSNQLIYNAIEHPSVLKEGETPRSYAREIELQQGRHIVEAASSVSGLRRIVWSSLASPKKWSHGHLTKVSMFDTKEEIADLFLASQVRDKLSVVLVGFYATNALKVPELYGPLRQADSSYELALPMSGDVPVPIADLERDLGPWIDALFQCEAGLLLVGSTSTMSWKEWLEAWARHNGVSAQYRRATSAEYAAKIPAISDAVLEEFAFVEQYGFAGGNPAALYPVDIQKRGVDLPRNTIEDQIRTCDWSGIL